MNGKEGMRMCGCCGGPWIEELLEQERGEQPRDPKKQAAEEPEKKAEPVPPR